MFDLNDKILLRRKYTIHKWAFLFFCEPIVHERYILLHNSGMYRNRSETTNSKGLFVKTVEKAPAALQNFWTVVTEQQGHFTWVLKFSLLKLIHSYMFDELCRGTQNLYREALIKDCYRLQLLHCFQNIQIRFTYREGIRLPIY